MAERRVERIGKIMLKKKLGFLLGVMVFLSLAGYLVCLAAGSNRQLNKEKEFLLVTSFYPMFVLAENLTAGTENIEVSNLTENQTGCLHDYQLFPEDMKKLLWADAFLINGAGMELFMEKVIESNQELYVMDASRGISLLEGEEHHHHGKESGHEEESHDGHAHGENGHLWMDVERYRVQLSNVTKELQNLLPEQADVLAQAADVYDDKLKVLSAGIADLSKHTQGMPVVIFHEAFAYLAESLGMEVLKTFSLDENNRPSPGDIVEVMEEINYHGTALIFIEEEQASYAEKLLEGTEAKVVYINPLTTGDGAADSYLAGMWDNLSAIRQAVE